MFNVYVPENNVICISTDVKGGIHVYDNSLAKTLKPVDSFEVDGVSDFNHAMKAMIEKYGKKPENPWLDKPDSNGLWWYAYKDEYGNFFSDVVSVNLTNPDGSVDDLPITVMGSGEEVYNFEDEKFSHCKWQKVVEPTPFEEKRDVDE